MSEISTVLRIRVLCAVVIVVLYQHRTGNTVVVVVVGSERRQNNLVIKSVLLFVYCITSALASRASGALVVPCF